MTQDLKTFFSHPKWTILNQFTADIWIEMFYDFSYSLFIFFLMIFQNYCSDFI